MAKLAALVCPKGGGFPVTCRIIQAPPGQSPAEAGSLSDGAELDPAREGAIGRSGAVKGCDPTSSSARWVEWSAAGGIAPKSRQARCSSVQVTHLPPSPELTFSSTEAVAWPRRN